MKTLNFLLTEVPLFHGLDKDELQPLTPLFIERKYKKGEMIFWEGDQGEEFFIIKAGSVKIYRFDDHKEVILDLFKDGDYFGEMALFDEQRIRSTSAECLTPSTVYILKREDFHKLLEAQPKLTMKLLSIALQRIRRSNELIRDLTFLDVRTRTYRVILRLAAEHGVEQHTGILIDLPMTHQQLANLVGTVREAVSKVLNELQQEELIEIDKKRITLKDKEALESRIPLS